MKNTIQYHLMSLICLSVFLPISTGWSATPVDLRHAPLSYIQKTKSFSALNTGSSLTPEFKTVSSYTDFSQTKHERLKQTYHGYNVWGGDVVIHTPKQRNSKFNSLASNKSNAHMNGLMYQDLTADLIDAPTKETMDKQQDSAITEAIKLLNSQAKNKAGSIKTQANQIVFVDANHKAHWAFYIELTSNLNDHFIQRVYILDATTQEVYKTWDNLKTIENSMQRVNGGGFGGNDKIGHIAYDGITSHARSFSIFRDETASLCYLRGNIELHGLTGDFFAVNSMGGADGNNLSITVTPVTYPCAKPNPDHAGLYWNDDMAFETDNNAFYHANIASNMYMSWYSLPVVLNPGPKDEDGNSDLLPVQIYTHLKIANAFWAGSIHGIVLGDGDEKEGMLPLTSLDIIAHELSHGFTEQHSNLIYADQSGGLNESFSDMAGVAAGYFDTGVSNWKIGADVMIATDALRYMDNPRRDCAGKPPTQNTDGYKIRHCSIDHMKDYQEGSAEILGEKIPLVDVHFSSGIFNKAFYLMAQGWGGDSDGGTRKAFNVMVQANRGYWTQNTTFQDAACGVMDATHDYGYDESVVTKAMAAVGLDTSKC